MVSERSRPGPWGTALRGVAMGAADLVPGVSGGTVALIVGIYARLVASLAAFTRRPFRAALRGGRFRVAWRAVDGPFLAFLALGIGAAIVGASQGLRWLLEAYRPWVYAAFFGLIAASAVLVVRRARTGTPRVAAAFAVAAAATFALVGLAPRTTPDSAPVLFLAGAVAVSALLLPGVSGAFLLLLFGKYETVLEALGAVDLSILLPLALGMGVGLLAFSRVLAWALARWHDLAMGALGGVLLGSLRRVWPFQAEATHVPVNVSPPGPLEAALAAAVALLAAGSVLLLERVGR